ncbi:3'-phosphoadenosine 5'-phosphosulfate (PAPS) 3'-phosphatase [Halopolyspora algeriensis]|uniref:3'-phosphoadenosine 5'-phosphosulfate (PAPS) 3'-phosphatase n=1 Tax=Halopolyspora algeriensis TaxID=1500506 RepID=A0A368VWQ1_9ACTN|nr:3'-phosphoadenosine 5'-phosphosulfate (PAPS) 3'-phosphatase [Halopolyspora algeriensis]TQM55947.1 3'-phosphoadenosine 5'-phosphosulfate (PAPS) 3'-phosphatase [Halopolyspora algeriensis]
MSIVEEGPQRDSEDVTDARLAEQLARQAGELLVELRGRQADADPGELREQGDRESDEFLLRRLAAQRPHDAVLSEESTDDSGRLGSSRVWIIDPLDGTREFGAPGRTDWAVHVALWEAGRGITAAAVAQPARGVVHTGENAIRPAANARSRQHPRIVVSDTRPPPFADELAAAVGAELVPLGSAGAKAMAVLSGEADAYVHSGGQWEWDSAAPAGVVLAAGLHAGRIDGTPLRYNQPHPYLPGLLICLPELADPLLEAIAASTRTG